MFGKMGYAEHTRSQDGRIARFARSLPHMFDSAITIFRLRGRIISQPKVLEPNETAHTTNFVQHHGILF